MKKIKKGEKKKETHRHLQPTTLARYRAYLSQSMRPTLPRHALLSGDLDRLNGKRQDQALQTSLSFVVERNQITHSQLST